MLFLKSAWKWLGDNDKQVKIVFAIIAAVYVIAEYRIKVHSDRAAAAMSYLNKYDEEKMLQVREKVLHDLVEALVIQMSTVPEDKRVKAYSDQFQQRFNSNEDTKQGIYTLLEFYRDLGVCVESSNCDSHAICGYFFDDIQSFREMCRPISVNWQEAEVLDELVKSDCETSLRKYCKDRAPNSPDCVAARARTL